MDLQNKFTPISKEKIINYVREAQMGSEDAFETLRVQYRPLIDSQVHKYFSDDMSYDDAEDMRQEALIAFHSAVMNYDCAEDGVEFGLFAKICIGNGIKTFLRDYKKRFGQRILSLEDIEADDAVVNDEPASSVISHESMQQLISIIQDSLSPFEARVWWLYVSGMSAADVSKKLGHCEVRSVENAIYRIRRKLRRLLED